jgi:hypothetical protein
MKQNDLPDFYDTVGFDMDTTTPTVKNANALFFIIPLLSTRVSTVSIGINLRPLTNISRSSYLSTLDPFLNSRPEWFSLQSKDSDTILDY